MRGLSRRAQAAIALVVVGGSSLARLARTVHGFGAAFTDDDQTIFWVGAREMSRGAFHEPCFYGQAYNTLFEALLAAPAVAVGASIPVAVSLAATAVGLLPFFALALLALRRERLWLALLALGAPLLLPARFAMILTMARGFHTGLAFVTLGLCVAAWRTPASPLRMGLGVFLLLLGMFATPSAALLGVPAIFSVLVDQRAQMQGQRPGGRGTRARLLILPAAGATGALLAAGLWALMTGFYTRHPEWSLYPLSGLRWRPDLLAWALTHLDAFLGDVSPLLGAHGALWLVPLLALLAITLRARRWPAALALLLAAGLLLASLGFAKVHQGSESIYYPRLRMFLAVPALFVWLALMSTPKDASAGALRFDRRAIAVLALCAIFAPIAHARLTGEIARSARQGSVMVLHARVAPLRARCDRLAAQARKAGAPVIVFLHDRIAAYGCAALLSNTPQTLLPDFERRTWRLLEENLRRPEVLLFADLDPAFCLRARRAGLRCTRIAPDLARVEPRGRTTLQTVRAVGGKIRRYHGLPHDAQTGVPLYE